MLETLGLGLALSFAWYTGKVLHPEEASISREIRLCENCITEPGVLWVWSRETERRPCK